MDEQLIRQRKEAYGSYQALTPTRRRAGRLTGFRRDRRGRARVILDMAEADLEADDIPGDGLHRSELVAPFVTIKGLVTKRGALMTHGAVICREYGLPAVVGVEHTIRLIREGQRIRVDGTDGYVEILP